jgi:hypothetical protein
LSTRLARCATPRLRTMSNVTPFPEKPAGITCTMHTINDPILAGQEAWVRIKQNRAWADWVVLGHALAVGRTEAMKRAGTNEPNGRRYNREFGYWLGNHGFRDIPDSARTRLLKCIGRLPEVEAFLEKLELQERLRLNHPVIVWNAFRRENKKPKPPTGTPVPDWVKAFFAAPPEERAAGFARMSLADFLEILPSEWRDELMSRIIKLANNKTGTPDPRMTKILQTMIEHNRIVHNKATDPVVVSSHLQALKECVTNFSIALRAINRKPSELAVVLMNPGKQRAA